MSPHNQLKIDQPSLKLRHGGQRTIDNLIIEGTKVRRTSVRTYIHRPLEHSYPHTRVTDPRPLTPELILHITLFFIISNQ